MSENSEPILQPDPVEQAMVQMRQDAIAMIAKMDPVMLDQLHAVIRRTPGAVAAATVAGVLADIICAISKTEEGIQRNVLILSEMILKLAVSSKKNAPTGSIIH